MRSLWKASRETLHLLSRLSDFGRLCGEAGAGMRLGNRWKGDTASYSAFHKRLYKARGRPSLCEDCGSTTAKRFEWANMSGNYHDLNDYKRLCTSCHRYHDGHSRGPKSGMWKGGPLTTACAYCNAVFSRRRNGHIHKFCSIQCCGKLRKIQYANAIR